jgi:hypothetical protein
MPCLFVVVFCGGALRDGKPPASSPRLKSSGSLLKKIV